MMAPDIVKKWDYQSRQSVVDRVEEKIHTHHLPLKQRISDTIYRLKTQQEKLEGTSNKMVQHEKALFQKCVDAKVTNDDTRAAMYANECAEARKISKVLLKSQLAIEQVVLRLETVEEFGDVAVAIAPTASVIHALHGQLSGVLPQVSRELGEIDEVIGGIVTEAGPSMSAESNVVAMGEAKNILAEADTIAEQRMKDRLPQIPGLSERTAAGQDLRSR